MNFVNFGRYKACFLKRTPKLIKYIEYSKFNSGKNKGYLIRRSKCFIIAGSDSG